MKRSVLLISLLLAAGLLFAQTAAQAPATTAQAAPAAAAAPQGVPKDVGGPDGSKINVDRAQQELRMISIEKFEDDGLWVGTMPRDDGFIHIRRFNSSGPADKKPVDGETEAGIKESDKYVLGVKIEHTHRSSTYFELTPLRPIPIPGIAKTISISVVGRNVKHQLYVMITDHFGNRAKIPMGDLGFTGWKTLTAAIPPNIKQSDPRYNNKQGIFFSSLLIEADPEETYGSYYIYFDDLRVLTDLFSEDNRDPDDIQDAW